MIFVIFDTTTKSDSLWVMRQKYPLHENSYEHDCINQRLKKTKNKRYSCRLKQNKTNKKTIPYNYED